MFIFSNVLVIFGFFFSTFFRSTKAALAASFLFIAMSHSLGWLFVHFIYGFANGEEEFFAPFMIHPFLVFYRYLDGLAILLFYYDGKGLSTSFDDNHMGGMLGKCLLLLILHWFIWFFAWLYVLNVFNVGDGTKQHPLFFLNSKYWKSLLGYTIE